MSGLANCVEAGQGDVAVLLLHGIGGGKAIWRHTLPALAAAGFRAVAMDLPGYGGAPGVPSLDAMTQAVADTVALIGARRTVLLGHSMGGMVAQALVARQPDIAQGLVLACTSASFGKSDGAWQAQFVADRLAPLDAGMGMAGMAARLVPAMVSPQASADAVREAVAIMSAVPEATYRAALYAIAAFDCRAALARIRMPTLLLAAENDRTAPPDVMQRMAARIPNSEYACLPAAGHIANVEQPAAFNAAVLSFLKSQFVKPNFAGA